MPNRGAAERVGSAFFSKVEPKSWCGAEALDIAARPFL